MSFKNLPIMYSGQIETAASVATLPAVGVVEGALRFIEGTNDFYWYDGSSWSLLAGDSSVQAPVMTTVQRDALTPSAGWIVFNSTTGALETYNGAAWV